MPAPPGTGGGRAQLDAKLFAALAGTVSLIAFLGEKNPFHYLSFTALASLLHAILSVRRESGALLMITGFYARLYLALVCAALALAYFGVTRFARRSPNRTLGLVSFLMVVSGIVFKSTWSLLTKWRPVPETNVGLFLAYVVAYNSFYWGVLLSVVLLGWCLLREVRSRLRSSVSTPSG